MKSYSEVMADFLASGPDYIADLPDNWKQGRTAFGGLTSALLVAAIQNDHPELPPIRTAQINFIGPAVDRLNVAHKVLRQGKNNVTVSATLDSEAGPGTHGLFTYGVSRELPQEMDYPARLVDMKPEDAEPFFPTVEGAPHFFDQFGSPLGIGPPLFRGL